MKHIIEKLTSQLGGEMLRFLAWPVNQTLCYYCH